jgi:hypothetical protein
MKKVLLLASLLAFSVLGLSAQSFPVQFQGEKPTISDLAWAYVNYESTPAEGEEEEEECADESARAVKSAMTRQRANKAQEPGVTLSIDQRNGFVLYEWKDPDSGTRLRIEMCYWNESDGKHKLFACGTYYFDGDQYSAGQFDGLTFYRYDNAAKTLTWTDDIGFEVEYGTDDDAWVTYDLPRSGKNITVNYWYGNGTHKQKTLQFDGRRFSF